MDSSSFQSHLDFYMPPCGVCNTKSLRFTPELLKIFYIARVIFSSTSTHRIKSQASPLFNREEIFVSEQTTAEAASEEHEKSPMDNFINLAKITSLRDIAHLLPREHVIYAETIFYKKLANRELIKIDYESPTGGIASVDNFVSKEEVELKRSQKIYILFDNSTSMNGDNFKKLFVSKAIALEYARRVSAEQPQLYFRTFHSEVGELVKAGTQDEIQTLIQYICQLKTGGGRITNIGDAVVQAMEDIKSDPEMEQAEILVMTDGFGPVPKDLLEQLGRIKLHILLIPDLDIEKILKLYPNRKAWEAGGPSGTRPMPEFWSYYSNKPPPMILNGDDLYQDKKLSYNMASKSVKDLKMLEILQGLNQIYNLQETCSEFIFVVISSIMGDTFEFTMEDLAGIEKFIEELDQQKIEPMTNEEKLQFLQSVNFLIQFLTVARTNTKERRVLKKIKELMKEAARLQARIMADPWVRSVLKVDNIKFNLKFDIAATVKKEDMNLLAAFSFLIKVLWQRLLEALRIIKDEYRI